MSWHVVSKRIRSDWEATWQEGEREVPRKPGLHSDGCAHQKGGDFNIDAKINGAYIVMGMLYGDRGDFDQIDHHFNCAADRIRTATHRTRAACTLYDLSVSMSLADKYVSALEKDKKFSYHGVRFSRVWPMCASSWPVRSWSRRVAVIETDEDGEEVFVIPATGRHEPSAA